MSSTGVNKEIKTLLEMVEDQQHLKNPQNVIDQRAKCFEYFNSMTDAQKNFLDEVRWCLESGLEWGNGK